MAMPERRVSVPGPVRQLALVVRMSFTLYFTVITPAVPRPLYPSYLPNLSPAPQKAVCFSSVNRKMPFVNCLCGSTNQMCSKQSKLVRLCRPFIAVDLEHIISFIITPKKILKEAHS